MRRQDQSEFIMKGEIAIEGFVLAVLRIGDGEKMPR
jgi:hypothetical protein